MTILQNVARVASRVLDAPMRSLLIALFAFLLFSFPVSAHAGEGDHVRLQFQGLDQILLIVALVVGVVAIAYGFLLAKGVMAASPGDARMQEVGKAIRDGAVAYLRQQIRTMLLFVALLVVGLIALYFQQGLATAVGIALAFVFGVAGSYVAGSTGMMIAVNANMRTANAALTSYKRSLEIAFRSGAVAGLLTVGVGLVGASLILLVGGEHATRYLIGFGFGGSLAALFMRVGGGIFTKAADVGADLVGKVEAGIPEDDPRNPAVIADNVGDNVGDCAGMAADVFESYIVTIASAIVLASATSAVVDVTLWTRLVVFAITIASVGIIASIVGIATMKGSDDLESDPLQAIRGGFARTAIIAMVLTFVAAWFLLGQTPIQTSRLIDSKEFLRKDLAFFKEARVAISKREASAAVAKQAQQDAAKRFGKPVSGITAADIFADPAKVPASLAGISQAAVDRALTGSKDPINDYEVTALDIAMSPEAKARGFRADDSVVIQRFLTGAPEQSLSAGSLAGYVKITDFDSKTTPALDYAVSIPQGDPAFNPTAPFKSVRSMFRSTGSEQLVVARIKLKYDIPARPATGGAPPAPATVIDREGYLGPAVQSEIDKTLKTVKDQATQIGAKGSASVDKSFPVALYVKPETNELALGISSEVPQPYQLEERLRNFGYFRKSAESLNASAAKSGASGKTPVNPPSNPMQLGAVESHPIPWLLFPGAVLVGILLAFAIEKLTEYYVSTHMRPTQEVSGVSSGGAAPMLIQGFAYALESSSLMTVAIVAAVLGPLFLFPTAAFGGYVMALYGIALVGLGLLTTTGYVLAMDTFGPISDNAQGVFEMSGNAESHPEAARAVGRLDAAGNTTKALTKGFAIATAVVAAIALFNSYRGEANLTEIGLKLDVPEIFLGLLIGGAAPFLFSAFAINAVGRSAFELINEVRRQFRENPGIMLGTVKPDYAKCVAIVTASAQKELLAPGVLAITLPIAVAFGFSIGKEPVMINGAMYNITGAQALGGFLAGAILSGQLMAVMLSNAGGMWDNAKKLIEDGMYGGKGSDAHKASVICDTVGDPFKDTAGPALNPLIKVMNLVALLLAPAIIQPLGTAPLVIITVVAVGLLVGAIALAKKGSLSEELQKAAAEAHNVDEHVMHPSAFTHETTSHEAAPTDEAPRAKRRITVEDDEVS